MATVKIDLALVLSAYSATLKQPSRTLVRDIKELPYPKEVIKMVLKHCIKLTEAGSEQGGVVVKALHERHAVEAAALMEEMKAPDV